MPSDFFGRQDRARAGSRILIAGLVLALIAMAVAVHVAVTGVSLLMGGSASLLEPNLSATLAIGLVWLTVAFGAFFRWLDVRAGGAALARGFGAVPVVAGTEDARLRTLTAVIAEMAVAASCPEPDAFFLARDSGINAFVVGHPDRPALAVSRGAVERLERDELRAVVAHEIAHVVQGDLALNMRMLVVLGGLLALDEVGRTVNGPGSAPGEPMQVHPGMLVGWPLRALGGIGWFGASVIRAALSRRREFLADATAVQYCRQPFALATALAAIRDADPALATPPGQVREIAHLCFSIARPSTWYRRILSSHPPLQARIDALDPHMDLKRRKRASPEQKSSPENVSGGMIGASPVALTVENPVSTFVVSDRIVLLVPKGSDCLAALCALFAGDEAIERSAYVGALRFAFDERLADRVEMLLPLLKGELDGDRLGLVEHVTTVLRETVTHENRGRILLRIERLLLASGALDICRYSTLQLLRRKLDVEFPLLEQIVGVDRVDDERTDRRKTRTFDEMAGEFALLLSLMVESSGAADDILDREFAQLLRCYTTTILPRRRKSEPGIVVELEQAFQTLYVQPESVRRAFVQHCVEIMQADGHIARAERTLLTLFAASLDCADLAVDGIARAGSRRGDGLRNAA